MFGGSNQDQDRDEDYEDVEDAQEVDNQYYQILGVDRNATQEQIKSAYEKLISTLHPDENEEDEHKIQLINDVYEILSDPQKRADYDKYGKAQEEETQNLFDMFFNPGKKANPNQKPKVQSTQQLIEISLESIYNGGVVQFPHTRMRCCQKCQGKGGANVRVCASCKGQGGRVQMYQVGPGMYQQVQKICEECSGKGQLMEQTDRCQVCEGKKILEKKTVLDVNISKGTPNKFVIKMPGEGNQIPDALPGDLILVTKEKQHQVFKRSGADLLMKKTITLVEALTGFEFTVKHLDEKEYTIYASEGEVISDEAKKIVKGLGMPFFKNPEEYGNLIIEFHVTMPKRGQLSKGQVAQLIAQLPGQTAVKPEENCLTFEDLDVEELNTNEEGGKKPEDEYDEEAEQQGISCSTQ